MDESHKLPRIIAKQPTSRSKLPRRAALKGFGAIAVAAVGCSTDRGQTAATGVEAAGKATTGPAPSSSSAGAQAQAPIMTSAGTKSAAGAGAGAAGTGHTAAGAATPATAGTVSAANAGATGSPVSTAGASGSAAGGGGAAGSGTAGTAAASGSGGAAASGTTLASLQCIATPAMTDGPFFVEEKLQRADLLMGETDDAIVKALPLKLVIGVYQVEGMQCVPVQGATVDIWQANALGVYSDVTPGAIQSVDTRGKKFLRGYQVTDEVGMVQFETIYPGWYMSRTIHIHFKIRKPASSGKALEFTSQMFFDEDINMKVLAMAPYSSHPGQRSVFNDDDHIFNGTLTNGQKPPAGMDPPGKSIMPMLVSEASGYTATLKVGLRI